MTAGTDREWWNGIGFTANSLVAFGNLVLAIAGASVGNVVPTIANLVIALLCGLVAWRYWRRHRDGA